MSNIKSQNKQIYGPYDQHISDNLSFPFMDDKTKQSFGDECDINCIMAKYERTGIIESGNSSPPQYGEASAFDFQQAVNLVLQANNMFDSLPANVRYKFANDPHTMLSWMDNPENQAEAIQMGLLPTPIVLPHTPTTSPAVVASMPHQTATKGAGASIPPV